MNFPRCSRYSPNASKKKDKIILKHIYIGYRTSGGGFKSLFYMLKNHRVKF